jgi:hypothetical protein
MNLIILKGQGRELPEMVVPHKDTEAQEDSQTEETEEKAHEEVNIIGHEFLLNKQFFFSSRLAIITIGRSKIQSRIFICKLLTSTFLY